MQIAIVNQDDTNFPDTLQLGLYLTIASATLTSKSFRKDFIKLLRNFWNKFAMGRTQIIPINDQTYSTTNVGTLTRDKQQKTTS
ncbi:unnamed protein product [Adineta ricciae]|nr:unnamed protein product [Adineta ricciae]